MIMFRRYRLFGNQLVEGVGEIGISSSGRIRRNGACHAEDHRSHGMTFVPAQLRQVKCCDRHVCASPPLDGPVNDR